VDCFLVHEALRWLIFIVHKCSNHKRIATKIQAQKSSYSCAGKTARPQYYTVLIL
jgi:hypothetical protein